MQFNPQEMVPADKPPSTKANFSLICTSPEDISSPRVWWTGWKWDSEGSGAALTPLGEAGGCFSVPGAQGRAARGVLTPGKEEENSPPAPSLPFHPSSRHWLRDGTRRKWQKQLFCIKLKH